METRQLVLLSDEPSRDWRLDDHTRQVGRAGIAAARDALRAARSRQNNHSAFTGHDSHTGADSHTGHNHPHAA